MKRIFMAMALLMIFLPTFNVQADSLIGVAPGIVSFSVDDPDGATDSTNGLMPLSLAFIYDLNNKTRLYSTANYIDFELDASTNRIGQDVTGYQISASWQHVIRLSQILKFYAGAGLAYTQADFDNRYTVDVDGYLAKRYDDRQQGFISAVLSLSREWELTDRVDLGLDLSYQLAVSADGFSGLKAALCCFYRF